MTTYITRVEIQDVPSDHSAYDDLQKLMFENGFDRFIVAPDGETAFWLPSGTYALHDVTMSTREAELLAAKAAARTGYQFSSLTMNADDWRSHNLVRCSPASP